MFRANYARGLTLKIGLILLMAMANNTISPVITHSAAGDLKIVNKKIEVQGHRGARSVLPENTLPAFEYAMNIGVDILEFDLGVTADHVVIVSHDQKPNKTICQYLDGSPIEHAKWFYQMSLEDAKQIDCGAKPNPRFPRQSIRPKTQIPTLAEVFELVATSPHPNAKTIEFNIETKSDPRNPQAQPEPELFVELILTQVKKYALEDRVTIQSFDHRTLREVAKRAPNIQRSALFAHAPDDWVLATQASEASIVSPDFTLIDKASVRVMQSAGLRVIPWTANTKQSWQRLIDYGVDGIISDDPEPLIEYLSRQ